MYPDLFTIPMTSVVDFVATGAKQIYTFYSQYEIELFDLHFTLFHVFVAFSIFFFLITDAFHLSEPDD